MKKQFGYALIDGAFGPDASQIVKDWSNVYVAWSWYGYWKGEKTPDGKIDEKAWLKRMADCLKRVYTTTNMKIYLGLFGQRADGVMITADMISKVFKLMSPYWDRVVAVDIADEPKWTRQETKANLAKVRLVMTSLALPDKPLGITYTAEQSLTDPAFGIPPGKGPDFVTLELYSPDGEHPDKGQAANIALITKNVKAAWARMPPKQKCWYWLCGFNRNGYFKSEDNLAALQWDTYKLVKDDPKTEGIAIFNWGRTFFNKESNAKSLGTKWLPKVQTQHKRIAKDLGI